MADSEKAWVEIPEGYLILNSKEALDLFDALTTSGTLWEQLSVLFNDYALNKNKSEELETKVGNMQELMSTMIKSINSMNSQLPPPQEQSKSYSQQSIVEPAEVHDVTIKTASKKKTSEGLSALKKKMSKFKS